MALTKVTSAVIKDATITDADIGSTLTSAISGSTTALSSSIATRFDSRESDMTLATASIAAITSSISTINDNMTLATASIAAITASLGQPVNTDSNVTFNNINSTGTITAVEVHTTFVSSSIAVISGSNTFGDDTSDSHQFTGSLSVSSSLSVIGSGTITGTLGVNGSPGEANSKFAVDGNIEMLSGSNRLFIPRASDGALTTSIFSRTGNNLTLSGAGSSTGQIEFIPSSANSSRVVMLINKDSRISLSNNDAGTSNTIFGKNAGDAITSGGNYNVAIGEDAAGGLTTADNSIAIGFEALKVHTIGGNNLAIGFKAMVDTDAGSTSLGSVDNIFIGRFAGGGTWVDSASSQNIGIGNSVMDAAMDAALDNVAIGHSALTSLTTGDDNVIIGSGAAASLTTGKENVVVGSGAYATANTSENYGVAIGFEAAKLLDGIDNVVAIGHSALSTMVAVDGNTALGFEAGKLTVGNSNTLIGHQAGKGAAGTDENNTAVGYQALMSVAAGDQNTAIGGVALKDVNSGEDNVAVGFGAGENLTTNGKNVLIGRNAGANLAAGIDGCVAIGFSALDAAVDTGHYTIAIGQHALGALTSGDRNIGIGYSAGLTLTSSNDCVFIGYEAGKDCDSTGSTPAGCIYVGTRAGENLDDGTQNVAIGHQAMRGNTENANTPNNSVAIGYDAIKNVTDGDENVCVGHGAGVNITEGSSNVMIGDDCVAASATGNNAHGLGNDLSCVSGYTTFGDTGSDIRAAHGNITWATVSDKRFKKDIETSTAGLSFVNDLRPITYHWRAKGEVPEWSPSYEEGSEEQYRNAKHNHGFVAQEVKAVIDAHPEIKDGFSMWTEHEDLGGQQEVGETALIPVLVKAVQELSEKIKHIEKTCKCMKEE